MFTPNVASVPQRPIRSSPLGETTSSHARHKRYDTNDERSSLLLSHTDQEIGLEGLEKTSTGDVKGLVEVSDTLEITTSV